MALDIAGKTLTTDLAADLNITTSNPLINAFIGNLGDSLADTTFKSEIESSSCAILYAKEIESTNAQGSGTTVYSKPVPIHISANATEQQIDRELSQLKDITVTAKITQNNQGNSQTADASGTFKVQKLKTESGVAYRITATTDEPKDTITVDGLGEAEVNVSVFKTQKYYFNSGAGKFTRVENIIDLGGQEFSIESQ